MVIAMYSLFRRTGQDGQIHWIDGSYPEILGLIGYAYFAVCLLYIPFRRWLIAPFLLFVALVTFNAVTTAPFIAMVRLTSYCFMAHSTSSALVPVLGQRSSASRIMGGSSDYDLRGRKRFRTFARSSCLRWPLPYPRWPLDTC